MRRIHGVEVKNFIMSYETCIVSINKTLHNSSKNYLASSLENVRNQVNYIETVLGGEVVSAMKEIRFYFFLVSSEYSIFESMFFDLGV